MTYSLFISESQIKNITPIDDNMEVEELRPFIIQAQDLKLQSLIGTQFMQDLMVKIDLNTLNDAEEKLIEYYIQPLIANYAIYLAVPSMAYKMLNKSLMQLNSEEGTAASLDVVKYFRDAYKNNSDYYANRLKDYLCDYSELFPLYGNSTKGMPAMPSKSFGGFYTPISLNRRPNGYDYPSK